MCVITLTSLVFDQTAETLRLSGTSDCAQITAQVVTINLTTEVTTTVRADGTWDVDFDSSSFNVSVQDILRQCEKETKFRAFCTEDPTCIEDAALFLRCDERGNDPSCPTLELRVREIGRCVDGTATVTFEVAVTNPTDPLIYEIVFGDGDDETVVVNDSTPNPNVITHDYLAGSFTAVVNIVFPEDCRSSNQVSVEVDCEPVREGCPSVELRLASLSRCDADNGRSTANFEITVTGAPATDCVYEIDFGDGQDENITFNSGTPNPITISHPYSSGAFSVVVNSVLPQGCESSNTVLVEAPECTKDCPGDIEFVVIDSNGRRFRVVNSAEGIFEAVVNNPLGVQIRCLEPGRYRLRITSPEITAAELENGDVEITWREDDQNPQPTNSREFPFAISEGETLSITATIDIVANPDCPVLSETVIIHACRKDDCCPELDGLSASCMTRCPPSTTVVLTAAGNDLECAEDFHWDFGDGDTAETEIPTVTHTYASPDRFEAEVTMVRPDHCKGDRIQQARQAVVPCPPNCFCLFLAIANGFLLLAFLTLMPLIACTADPGTQQTLNIILIVVTILLAIIWLWWLLDPCCRPTPCEHLRILFWVFSWALIVVGALAFMTFCVSAIPFGLFYAVMQQVLLSMINGRGCVPGAPSVFSWPFGGCR